MSILRFQMNRWFFSRKIKIFLVPFLILIMTIQYATRRINVTSGQINLKTLYDNKHINASIWLRSSINIMFSWFFRIRGCFSSFSSNFLPNVSQFTLEDLFLWIIISIKFCVSDVFSKKIMKAWWVSWS